MPFKRQESGGGGRRDGIVSVCEHRAALRTGFCTLSNMDESAKCWECEWMQGRTLSVKFCEGHLEISGMTNCLAVRRKRG